MASRRYRGKISSTLAEHASRCSWRVKRVQLPQQPATPAVDQQRQSELEEDLRLARDLQQGLLLEAVPRLPGWEMSAVSLPARELGGDLYDFVPVPTSCQGIMIGDVSGKGLPAALRMAVARTLFRQEARRGRSPGETLSMVNRMLIEEIPHGMVTMLYAVINTRTGEVSLANAGHNYPILMNGTLHELEISGLPLGVMDDERYEERRTILQPGNTAIFYTDGIVEAENAEGEIFGFERLAQLLVEHADLKPRALMARILADVRSWSGARSQADDLTMVLIRRRLATLGEEIRSVVGDVLGAEQAGALWENINLPPLDAPVEEWYTGLKRLSEAVQALAGRGIARELQQQLRLVIEEYRIAATPPEG
ncbi:MAG: stage II sporulation protein E [Herpetosiphonaceae bacterium]|nr:MAG: stage II sporulation protein E [Herpetosiphonaceae bacterium]